MIILYNYDKPTSVYVVNSRLPVYRAYYGDGLGNTIAGLFTRMAPKVVPFAKQLSMKAIDIRDKGINAVGDLAGKTFSAAKDKIMSSTTVMPASVSKSLNRMEETLASLATSTLSATPLDAHGNNIESMIAGSSFKQKRNKSFHR